MATFFEHQAQARRNTRWLLAGMIISVLATGVGIYAVIVGLEMFTTKGNQMFGYQPSFWHPKLFWCCVCGSAIFVGGASMFRIFSLRGGGARVAEMMGGRLASGQPRGLLEQRLLNVVDEMAIASGAPVPQVFVLENEAGINAFAAGFSLDDAAIAVTRGALEKLTRSELQGVIAHEFSHVLNGDMRLNTRLMGAVFGILCVGLCGRELMRLASRTSSWSSKKEKSGGYLFALGLGVFLVGWAGELMGKMIKAAVSRQREFLADASAAQFTRDPSAVAGALKKIGGYSEGARVAAPAAEEASHFFFGDLTKRVFSGSWFATHPPLRDRIARLDPGFRGEFAEVPAGVVDQADEAEVRGFASGARPGALPSRDRMSVGEPSAVPARDRTRAGDSSRLSSRDRTSEVESSALPSRGRTSEVEPTASALSRAPASTEPGLDLAATAADHIGSPDLAALDQSRKRIESLPAPLRDAAVSPFSACAMVYALWLVDGPELGAEQSGRIEAQSGPELRAEAQRLAPLLASLGTSERLSLVELAAPALRQLSADQRLQFARTIESLTYADRFTSIFEQVVGWMLTERLLGETNARSRSRTRHKRLKAVRAEIELFLSLLAHSGDVDGTGASKSFASAAARLSGVQLQLLPASERLISGLGPALNELRALSPELAHRFVDACAHGVLSDHRVSAEEATLLRVVCDALRCPLPLLGDEARSV